jgi:preprotein translocase subunit SecA
LHHRVKNHAMNAGVAPAPSLPILIRAKQWVWPRTRSPAKPEWRFIKKVHDSVSTLQDCTCEELSQRSRQLRRAVLGGLHPSRDEITVPGFSLVYEAMRRHLGIALYDEQLLAGLILTRRCVAEMQTGEGKTFLAALPAFVYALAGHGVHVVTANEYLAQRDYELLAPVFQMLGVSIGLNRYDIAPSAKHAAYACDVTYGADQEFGFDYLRDQLRLWSHPKPALGSGFRARLEGRELPKAAVVQRDLAVAIVDEIDSVLIDSATSPLLLSHGAYDADAEIQVYHSARDAASQFVCGRDFLADRTERRITITDAGRQRVFAAGESICKSGLRRPWDLYVEQALHAKEFLHKDVDYVIQGGKVLLVDEYTGRFYPDRQWRDGLHQAVEAKEGISVNAETNSMARISRQRYFQLYSHLSGMTGTAQGSEREFWNMYQLEVVAIPPHKSCQRRTLPTRYFAAAEDKYAAIVQEIADMLEIGRPVLVGTRTIKNSEVLAAILDSRGISYRLLNGKQDSSEAMIISRAGERGAVTIATNMAGRGTDIRLQPGVEALGGLHVIGVERHESRRIDRQLSGRTARQGDRGSCRFYVAADDPLIENFAPGLKRFLSRLADHKCETALDLASEIARVQVRVERQHYWARHSLFLHDRWLRDILVKCDQQP